MGVRWQRATFGELGGAAVYAMLQLRQRVFVVEQRCVFLDADGVDPACLHVLGWDGDALVAAARIVPAGRVHADVSIGRVVSAPEVRGTGVGRQLMAEAIALTEAVYGDVPIYLWAQSYLRRLYASFGFVVCGPEGEEDGILHLPMLRASAGHDHVLPG